MSASTALLPTEASGTGAITRGLSSVVGEATKAREVVQEACADGAGAAGAGLAGAAGGGGVTETALVSAGKIVACCGLPPPPLGWYGPFGFFRLVSFAFILASISGLILAVISLSQMDGLGFFSGLLLAIAAVVCAAAAYSHEGLAKEVTEVAEQNRLYTEKNDRMTKQLDGLGDVSTQMEKLQSELGDGMDQFTSFLDTLHRQTSIQQLATMLRAFCDSDRHGGQNPDQRLMKDEVEEFLDDNDQMLRGACPTFDFDAFRDEAVQHGLGMYAVRFMANALIASSSDNDHTSAALLSLIMVSFNPEKYTEHFLSDMKLACPSVKQQVIRELIAEKKENKARPDGSIRCQELLKLQEMILDTQHASADGEGAME